MDIQFAELKKYIISVIHTCMQLDRFTTISEEGQKCEWNGEVKISYRFNKNWTHGAWSIAI